MSLERLVDQTKPISPDGGKTDNEHDDENESDWRALDLVPIPVNGDD